MFKLFFVWHMKFIYFVAMLLSLKITNSFGDTPTFKAGSGFFINNKGDVLTNRHVVEKCDKKLLLFIDSKQQVHQAKIIAVSDEYDLAALKTDAKTDEFGSIATNNESYPIMIDKSGWELFSFGYPNGSKNQEWTAGPSIGTSTYNEPPYIGFAKLNATNGSSGSVVMDRSALVLGIVTAKMGNDNYEKDKNINTDQVIEYHNLNAIVFFANKYRLTINSYPRKEEFPPGFVMTHASHITGQIFCWLR
jgi:S1-C subfamily serine protease